MATAPGSYDFPMISDQEILTNVSVDFLNEGDLVLNDFTIREVILAESLTTPGLQTSIKAHSYIHNLPIKNFDKLKGATVRIKVDRPILKRFGFKSDFEVSQILYRLGGRSATKPNTQDNRKMINKAVEELMLHACDPTLLNNAQSTVSKSWKCVTPDMVVSHVLGTCLGVRSAVVDAAAPARDYIAENIYPFQVIAQQANAALHNGDDPSFVHFMTYEKGGTHHFRSLTKMCEQTPIMKLAYSATGNSYGSPNGVMHYTFPCDFDLLSDVMNGVGTDGSLISSLALINPSIKLFALLGNELRGGCGIGGGVTKLVKSNIGSEASENSCPDYASIYAQKRQARMTLLEKDKIALRLTVPWNPIYHVGRTIEFNLYNEEATVKTLNYGSGKYLISALAHTIRVGGYSTTTLDCVAVSVGTGGIV